MKNMPIHTGLYHLDARGIDYEVAHLYEHLVVASFNEYLKNRGYPYHLYGWLGGKTFRDVIFLEHGFYDEELGSVLADSLASDDRISLDLLDSELARIQAESLSVIKAINRDDMMRQLDQLNARQFIDHASHGFKSYVAPYQPADTPPVIELMYAPKKFRSITMAAHFDDPSPQGMIAFLRLEPLILDALDIAIRGIHGYAYDSTAVIRQTTSGEMSIVAIYDMPRNGMRASQIKALADSSIQQLIAEIQSHPDALTRYIQAFAATPNWHGFPIRYFKYTRIVTSRDAIAKVFTPERIIDILSRIRVHTQTTTDDDYDTVRRHQ